MTKSQRIAAAIKECLMVRKGHVLDDECIRDRAGNGAIYVLEALSEEEQTPSGHSIHGETPEEMAVRLIK